MDSSYVDENSDLGSIEGNCIETTVGRDSYHEANEIDINNVVNSQLAQEDEKGIMEVSSSISSRLLQIFENECVYNRMKLMRTFLNDQAAHFTGYVNFFTENPYVGVLAVKHFHIQIYECGKYGYELVVGDVKNKRIAVEWANNPIEDNLVMRKMDGIEENGLVDLESTGRRWEGGVLNGERCGYGKEYNDENNLVYEGFVFGGRRVCYGREYRGIRENKDMKNGLVYEGGYWNGVRYGFGISYNLNGEVDYEGEWVDNLPVNELKLTSAYLNDVDGFLISTLVEEIVIKERSLNKKVITSLHFSPHFILLKRIVIGNNCFEYVREFVLDGLNELESVKIGDSCFRTSGWKENDGGVCRIANCPNLIQLEIGGWCFYDFHQFELTNMNSLRSIQFGEGCVEYAEKCILKGE